MDIKIYDFPLPPSANKLHANSYHRGRKGRFTTPEYKHYKDQVRSWWTANSLNVNIYRKRVYNWLDEGWYLKIDCQFRFKKERLWTLDNKPKKLDSSNFIKACHDTLSNVLDVDDKYFWVGSFDKMPAFGGKECTMIKITKYFPSSDEESTDHKVGAFL